MISPKRPYELQVYSPETDLVTPQSELVFMIDHQSWTEPKQFPFDIITTFPDWSDATKAAILALLEVTDVLESANMPAFLAPYVLKATGSSLVPDTEIARLVTLKQNIYTIDLPSGATIEDRLLTADLPNGWTFTAIGDTGKNLQIVHTLTGRTIAGVTVKVTDINGTRMLVPFRDAYSGIIEPEAETIIIEGLATNDLPLVLILIFN